MEIGVAIDIAKLISLSYYNNIKFEYDENKSAANLKKHSISFEEAKALWKMPFLVEHANSLNEPRFMIVGKIRNKFYSCFYTVRRGDTIRLISVRRSRKSEKGKYYEQIKGKAKNNNS